MSFIPLNISYRNILCVFGRNGNETATEIIMRRKQIEAVLARRADEPARAHEERVAAWFASRARAKNTDRAYDTAWRCWAAWCEEREVAPVAPVEADISAWVGGLVLRGLALNTIRVYLSGVRSGLRVRGCVSRTVYAAAVGKILDGLRRERPDGVRQALPLTADLLRRCVLALPALRDGGLNFQGVRDRALLLVGYAGGLRRSEIASLNWADVTWRDGGVVLRVLGKTERRAVYLGIGPAEDSRVCPVAALDWWRSLCRQGSPVFHSTRGCARGGRLSHKAVGNVVKCVVKRLGLDPRDYSGHSLRAGLVTDLAPQVEAAVGMRQTRHKTHEMWGRYYRPGGALVVNYTRLAGL